MPSPTIIVLIFCKRTANFIRSVYRFTFGIKVSEGVAIAGTVVGSISFIYTGLQWMFGK